MAEPRIPEARDDDPEDVSDKLSIAAAMWARGDRADAVTWLRRAAESASDADLDLRALELAKLASELTGAFETAVPPKPEPARSSEAAPPAHQHKPPPKPSVQPPSSRPPGGKLPPLPPLRPLGSSPAAAPAQPRSPRVPSMVSSVSGVTSASGTIEREPKVEAPPRASSPMPWDDPRGDDEPTHQLPISAAKNQAPKPAEDFDTTAERAVVDQGLLRAMKTPAASDGAIRAAAVIAGPPVPSEPPPTRLADSTPRPSDGGRTTREPPYLPLAVGVRVRLVSDDAGVRVVPDDGTIDGGTVAILVPTHADDDLRVLFGRDR